MDVACGNDAELDIAHPRSPAGPESARLDGLDALRGIAALVVVVSHALRALPDFGTRPWQSEGSWLHFLLVRTPLAVLIDGHGAVLVFFVLSGLVLGRGLLAARPPDYLRFALKRWVRLYPP